MNTAVVIKPLVRTERLELRPLTEKDTDAVVGLFTDPAIWKTFMIPEYETDAEYRRLAATFIGFSGNDDPAHLCVGVCLDGKLIGFINDCGIEGGRIEVGYVIHPAYQGKGYATEALGAMLTELRAMGFATVRAGYFEENPGSRRVMEKCGMHPIGLVETGVYRGKTHRCLYCEIEL